MRIKASSILAASVLSLVLGACALEPVDYSQSEAHIPYTAEVTTPDAAISIAGGACGYYGRVPVYRQDAYEGDVKVAVFDCVVPPRCGGDATALSPAEQAKVDIFSELAMCGRTPGPSVLNRSPAPITPSPSTAASGGA